MWVIVAIIVVLAALGLWWVMSSQSVAVPAIGTTATTTDTGTTGTTGTTGGTPVTVPTTDRSSAGVVSVAENISGASTFGSWLASTGVAAQLTGKGPYTIFVPTDGAISQLPAGTFTNLSAAAKKRFVQYHVISGRAVSVDAQFVGNVTALSGDPLNFAYGTSNIPMVGSAIIIAEYKASNGVVYLINGGLLPPTKAQ
jgi:uncharacterized surface protein with fasciclin (FAS1) repeats